MPPPKLATDSLLAAPLSAITRLVLRVPLATLVLALVAAVASIAAAIQSMGFHTSRLDLLNPESSYNKLWINYINEFGKEDDTVIVIEGPDRETVIPVLEELSANLSQNHRLFQAVLHKVDLTKVRAKGLHFLSTEELRQIDDSLERMQPVFHGHWETLNLGQTVATWNRRLRALSPNPNPEQFQATMTEMTGFVRSLQESISQPHQYHSPWQHFSGPVVTASQLDSEYLLTNEGRLGFILLKLVNDQRESVTAGNEGIRELRRLIQRVQIRHQPHVQIGLTGLPVMEFDEMSTSQRDMLYAGVVSLTGVACLFVAGFGGLRHPLMTVAALLLALAWSFGFVSTTIGHLNILSMSFAVILIGLGIDFGIHYVARYLHLRSRDHGCVDALIETSRRVGPGIVVGGLTTAFAFLTAGLTEFTGIAELGIIAGGGILLCILAALLVLPAMIYFSDRNAPRVHLPEPFYLGRQLAPLFRFPFLTFLVALAVCMLVVPGVNRVWYDHNLLNLQPVGLESVQLERKLLEESDQSVWFALSIAETRSQLLERKKQFLQLNSVERTEEIVSLLPPEDSTKQKLIARIHQRLRQLPERPPLIPETPPEQLSGLLAITEQLVMGNHAAQQALRQQIASVRDVLRRIPLTECYLRLSQFQQRMTRDLLSRMYALRTTANPQPPHLNDLPQSLVTRFVGKNNRHLLKIYSRGDIWDMDALRQFVADIKRIDPKATGQPLQTYYASTQMQHSYIQAATYSLVAVCLVLVLDFQRVSYVLLALIPVGMGALMMFGIMGLMSIPLNPANMIVLPLILGIGIDDGVHVVHDFRNQESEYTLSDSTASAVLLTSLTTMVGFGSLMLASHLGLQSLGRVLTIGVSCCLFTSLVLLPALLSWISQMKTAEINNETTIVESAHPTISISEPLSPTAATRRSLTHTDSHLASSSNDNNTKMV